MRKLATFSCSLISFFSKDELGTWQKCVKIAETKLNNNQNVVIDNTNLDIESRQRYDSLFQLNELFFFSSDTLNSLKNCKFLVDVFL